MVIMVFIILFGLVGHITGNPAVNPYQWILDCSGKPLKGSNDNLFPTDVIIQPEETSVLSSSWASFMSNEGMNQITSVKINGCKLEHLEDVQTKKFPSLEFLSLNDMGRDDFDFQLLDANTELRELHLNDNKQLVHLYGNINTGLRTLNLQNTTLEDFPDVILQFKHSLKRLDISGNKGGVNDTEVCAVFEKLLLLNGKQCEHISAKSGTSLVYIDDNSSSNQASSTLLPLITAVLLGVQCFF